MVSKLATLTILFCGLMFGQSRNTVFQTLGENISNPFVSSPVTNIGQSGHLAMVLFSDAPGQTCTSPTGTGYFEGSPSNVANTYARFGMGTTQTNTLTQRNSYITANSSFPYVRFRLTAFVNANCRAAIYYVGTTAVPPINNTQGPVPNGNLGGPNPIVIGGMGLGVTTMSVCGTAGFESSLGYTTNTSLVAVSVNAGSSQKVYANEAITGSPSAYLCNAVLQGSASDTAITFTLGTGANCAGAWGNPIGPTGPISYGPLVLGTTITQLGQTIGSLISSPGNVSICITASGSGTVKGFVTTATYN